MRVAAVVLGWWLLLLLLRLLHVQGHGGLKEVVTTGRVASGHGFFGIGGQEEHAVVEQRLAETLLLLQRISFYRCVLGQEGVLQMMLLWCRTWAWTFLVLARIVGPILRRDWGWGHNWGDKSIRAKLQLNCSEHKSKSVQQTQVFTSYETAKTFDVKI